MDGPIGPVHFTVMFSNGFRSRGFNKISSGFRFSARHNVVHFSPCCYGRADLRSRLQYAYKRINANN